MTNYVHYFLIFYFLFSACFYHIHAHSSGPDDAACDNPILSSQEPDTAHADTLPGTGGFTLSVYDVNLKQNTNGYTITSSANDASHDLEITLSHPTQAFRGWFLHVLPSTVYGHPSYDGQRVGSWILKDRINGLFCSDNLAVGQQTLYSSKSVTWTWRPPMINTNFPTAVKLTIQVIVVIDVSTSYEITLGLNVIIPPPTSAPTGWQPPVQPSDPIQANMSTTSIPVNMALPTQTGSNPLVNTEIQWAVNSTDFSNSVIISSSITTYVIQNLIPGTTYFIRYRVYNQDMNHTTQSLDLIVSPWSNIIDMVTLDDSSNDNIVYYVTPIPPVMVTHDMNIISLSWTQQQVSLMKQITTKKNNKFLKYTLHRRVHLPTIQAASIPTSVYQNLTAWHPVYIGSLTTFNDTNVYVNTSYSYELCVHSLLLQPNCSISTTLRTSSCYNDCSNHGICGADNQCICSAGWLGPDCSIVSRGYTCSSQNQFCMEYSTDSTFAYVRMIAKTSGWAGLLLDIPVDGMTDSDAWIMFGDRHYDDPNYLTPLYAADIMTFPYDIRINQDYINNSPVDSVPLVWRGLSVTDRYSVGLSAPVSTLPVHDINTGEQLLLQDNPDLYNVMAYQNQTHMITMFQRYRVTNDPLDIEIPTEGGMILGWALSSDVAFKSHGRTEMDRGKLYVKWNGNQIQALPASIGYGIYYLPMLLSLLIVAFTTNVLHHTASFKITQYIRRYLSMTLWFAYVRRSMVAKDTKQMSVSNLTRNRATTQSSIDAPEALTRMASAEVMDETPQNIQISPQKQRMHRLQQLLSCISLDALPTLINLSWSEIWLLSLYIICICVSGYLSSHELYLIHRAKTFLYGHLLCLNLALTWIPVTHYVRVLAVPFDRAIKYHRWIGRITIILLYVHLITMLPAYNDSSPSVWNNDPTVQGSGVLYGTISLFFLSTLALLAIQPIRVYMYDTFRYSHMVASVIGTVFACLHSVHMRYFMLCPAIIIFADQFMRYYRTYILHRTKVIHVQCYGSTTPETTTQLKTEKRTSTIIPSQQQYVQLSLYIKNFQYAPGDYVMLQVPSISYLQWHPFSIFTGGGANATHSLKQHNIQNEDLVHLMIKRTGFENSFTHRLVQQMSQHELNNPNMDWSKIKVFVDGPYGSSQHHLPMPIEEYGCIILVAGGIGITPCASVLSRALAYRKQHPDKPFPTIHLIWSCADDSALHNWFPDLFQQLHDFDQEYTLKTKKFAFRLHLFHSHASRKSHIRPHDIHTAPPVNMKPSPSTSTLIRDCSNSDLAGQSQRAHEPIMPKPISYGHEVELSQMGPKFHDDENEPIPHVTIHLGAYQDDIKKSQHRDEDDVKTSQHESNPQPSPTVTSIPRSSPTLSYMPTKSSISVSTTPTPHGTPRTRYSHATNSSFRTFFPGRPNLPTLCASIAEQYRQTNTTLPGGMISCGPQSLCTTAQVQSNDIEYDYFQHQFSF